MGAEVQLHQIKRREAVSERLTRSLPQVLDNLPRAEHRVDRYGSKPWLRGTSCAQKELFEKFGSVLTFAKFTPTPFTFPGTRNLKLLAHLWLERSLLQGTARLLALQLQLPSGITRSRHGADGRDRGCQFSCILASEVSLSLRRYV